MVAIVSSPLRVIVQVEGTGPFHRFVIRAQDGTLTGRLYLGLWVERDAETCAEVGIAIAEAKGWTVVGVKL